MAQLATSLATFLSRFRVDKTGLTGVFDAELTWTVEQPSANLATGAPSEAPPNALGPSIFTALQEQLGLRLESARGPVDVLVIQSAERPEEN